MEPDYKGINPCGTYCYNCPDLGSICDGCRNRNGMPIGYQLYNLTEPCTYYKCCEENKIHDCSACKLYTESNDLKVPVEILVR
jgi:hypothetical protein